MRRVAEQFTNQPVHGPMLGCVSGDRVRIWVRTAREADVRVVASPTAARHVQIHSETIHSSPDTDFTAVAVLEGLEPNTSYSYWVQINGNPEPVAGETHQFHTLAATGQPSKFRIAFGGGAGYVPPNERVWRTIASQHPDALLLLGDNVYIDDPKSPEMQHYCYYRRQSRPEFRGLVAKTPVFSIWDDHDFGTNDCSGGPEVDVPAWKRPVYNVFRNNWVNSYYGGNSQYGSADKQPGCYYDFYLADVHFIMLDGRYYRDPKATASEAPTMLGPIQRKWLLDTISESHGRFIVLCSPVPWVYEAKGDSRDTWNGFRDERTQIFDFLAESGRDGVILMSADRHRSDLWRIERPNGYDLYEFNSSRLTNQHVHPTMKEAVFSYNKTQSFGTVDFDTTLDDPKVTYRVLTIDGEEVNSFTVRLSQLRD
jgi:alkaline phosphatase D